MAKYYEEAKIIANLMRDKNRLKAQISGASDKLQVGKTSNEKVTFSAAYRMRTRSVTGNVMIWNHPVYGTWGTDKWGLDADAFNAWVYYEGASGWPTAFATWGNT